MRGPGVPSAVLLVAVAGLLGCEPGDPLAPPTVYFGEDVCDVCGMIISDERFAAACIVRDAADGPRPRRFDDLGCLLAFERDEASGAAIAAGYVADYRTGAWIAWDAAHYVHAPALPTPMGSGLAAAREAGTVEAIRARHGGETLDLAGVREQFRRSAP